ncbi:MAG: hypothetical protein E2O40_01515 [Planctomycetota bacterium]|nr:MAG: hypothetical protein E2O40_01515 [Planctomycetota bacterium]
MLRVLITAIAIAACGGCRFSYAIPRAEAGEWMQKYYDATSPYAEIDVDHHRIGHRAGNVKRYAHNLNGRTTTPADPACVNSLMDEGFREIGLTAVEVDLRSSPLPDDTRVVIVHDKIKAKPLSDTAIAYMRNNTLESLFDHFLAQGYERDGRLMMLELKIPHRPDGELDEQSIEIIRRTATTIRSFDDHPQRKRLMASISFLTFSFEGLKLLRAEIGPDHGCGYFLLSSSNRVPSWIFDWFAGIPRFDDKIERTLAETPWITGTIFAPRWIRHFRQIFNEINDRRRAAGLRPLELHLAIYSEPFAEYRKLIARATNDGEDPLRNVKGLFFEIGP